MKKKIFKSFLIVYVLILVGCKNEKKSYYPTGELLSEIEYNNKGFKNGVLKEYYITGEIKNIEFYKNGKIVDTSKQFYKNGKIKIIEYEDSLGNFYKRFYENGNLMSEGYLKDTILIGWWNFYDNKGDLKRKIEYIDKSNDSIIKSKQYPNQIIHYGNDKTVLKDSSNYYKIELKDTLFLKEVTIGYIDLEPQLSKKEDFHMIYFWLEDLDGNKIKIDSTYGKNEKKAEIWLMPKNEGKQKLKGFIVEKSKSYKPNDKDSSMVDIISSTKKMFFEKEIYVKDNIEPRSAKSPDLAEE